MQILATLGDAPIAVIAVLAILLGVLLAARGPREKRAVGGVERPDESGRALLEVPPAAEQPAEEAPPATGKQPARRVAARAAKSALRSLKIGGKRKNR